MNVEQATIVHRVLLTGVETNLTSTTVQGTRSDADVALTLGPSFQEV